VVSTARFGGLACAAVAMSENDAPMGGTEATGSAESMLLQRMSQLETSFTDKFENMMRVMMGSQREMYEKVNERLDKMEGSNEERFQKLEKTCDEAMKSIGSLQAKVDAEVECLDGDLSRKRFKKSEPAGQEGGETAKTSSGSGVWNRIPEGVNRDLGGARVGGGGPGRKNLSYDEVRKEASAKGLPQANRLWVKGFGRKLGRETLREQAALYVAMVNDELKLEGDDRFKPNVYAWSLELSASLVFGSDEEAEDFYVRCKGMMFRWNDTVQGQVKLRITKDASFDQRLRNQVYWNLGDEVKSVLKDHALWNEGVMEVGNNGPRGTFYVGNGTRFWELFKVDVAKRGVGEFLCADLKAWEDWGMDEEKVKALTDRVMAKVTLLAKSH